MSPDPGVSGDMVKVSRTIHDTLSAGITPISRQFLMYQIHVLIQSIFRGVRARTLRTRKPPVIMLRVDVTPQVASSIELGPTLCTRVFTTLGSFEVWIANTRKNISRGRRRVLPLITIGSRSSLGADSGAIGGHLANTHTHTHTHSEPISWLKIAIDEMFSCYK